MQLITCDDICFLRRYVSDGVNADAVAELLVGGDAEDAASRRPGLAVAPDGVGDEHDLTRERVVGADGERRVTADVHFYA